MINITNLEQKSTETFSNLASLINTFEIKRIWGRFSFFVEDDYLHFETMLEEMILFQRISSQVR